MIDINARDIFFTSDEHQGHTAIGRLAGRPFADVDEQAEVLVENHNAIVPPHGLTIHCGDYALGDRARWLTLLDRMNGQHILLLGNHDKASGTDPNGWRHLIDYQAAGFVGVTQWIQMKLPPLTKKSAPYTVLASHYPYDGDSQGKDRHTQARLRDYGQILIHGHVHGEYAVRRSQPSATNPEGGTIQVNVGVDAQGWWNRLGRTYSPIPAIEVARLIHEVESGQTQEH